MSVENDTYKTFEDLRLDDEIESFHNGKSNDFEAYLAIHPHSKPDSIYLPPLDDVWRIRPHINSDHYLPGELDSYETCGTFRKAVSCEDWTPGSKHKRLILTHSCHRAGCPVCHDSWENRLANSVSNKLKAGKRLYYNKGSRNPFYHISLNPPPEMQEELTAMFEAGNHRGVVKLVRKQIKIMGLTGGVYAIHTFRKDPLISLGYPFSWHFHLIASGTPIQSDDFYKLTGWTYHNIRDCSNDLFDTMKYILSKSLNHPGHNAISWFGLYSPNKLCVDHITIETIEATCSCCQKPLYEYESVYSWDVPGKLEPQWDKPLGVYQYKLKHKHYKVVTPLV